jgi:hypothetical protein
MVMLFAAYERLLYSTCRSLLESAAALRVATKRLRPGFQVFAAYPKLQSVSDTPRNAIWKGGGPSVVAAITAGRCADLETSSFPVDGSFMKASQVELFFDLFCVGDPATVLGEVWPRLDTVVRDRNAIAHGRETADQVGRRYTFDDVMALIYLWHLRWAGFLDHVESLGQTRDFYRV